jgi:hypothetical protein
VTWRIISRPRVLIKELFSFMEREGDSRGLNQEPRRQKQELRAGRTKSPGVYI